MAYEDVYRSIRIRSGKIGGVISTENHPLIGTVAENSFPHHASENTAYAAAYAKSFDESEGTDGTWGNLSVTAARAGYTDNFQPFPDADEIGDMFAMGSDDKRGIFYVDVSSTNATYTKDSCKWEYWNGSAWTALTVFDGTDATAADGERPFQQDGYIVFDIPSDWELTTVGAQSAYWIRSYIYDNGVNQVPILEDEHMEVDFSSPFVMPYDGTIQSIRFTYVTNSATNADTKFQLYDLTNGKNIKSLTVTKGLQKGVTVNVNEIVDKDTQLVLFCIDEDGTTEYANGNAEFKIMRR